MAIESLREYLRSLQSLLESTQYQANQDRAVLVDTIEHCKKLQESKNELEHNYKSVQSALDETKTQHTTLECEYEILHAENQTLWRLINQLNPSPEQSMAVQQQLYNFPPKQNRAALVNVSRDSKSAMQQLDAEDSDGLTEIDSNAL
jgi:chromosome segregation ATPase